MTKFLENPYLALGLVVPGLIMLYIRSQFMAGQHQPRSETLLLYLVVSIAYYALIIPIVDLFLPQGSGESTTSVYSILSQESGDLTPWHWLLIVFVIPILVGLFLGLNIQKNILTKFLQLIGINLVHAIPTAWDWKFGNRKAQWVLVTLNDGTQFAGFLGSKSFISTSPYERDMYIQYLYEIDDEDNWTPRGRSGVLIASGKIKTIEFWPHDPEEDTNGPR